MRKITNNGLELIKKHEGFSSTIYKDAAGFPTIGYSHLIKPYEHFNNEISELEAESLLYQDVTEAELAVLRNVDVPLSDNQFDALVSFTFNLGSGALQRSTLRRKLNRGRYIGAAQEFKRWVYAGGRKLRGLIRRRNEESLLFLSC